MRVAEYTDEFTEHCRERTYFYLQDRFTTCYDDLLSYGLEPNLAVAELREIAHELLEILEAKETS